MAEAPLPFWSPLRDQILTIFALSILSVFTYAIYGAYFDSLSGYPGPKLWAISDLPRAFHMLKGDFPYKLDEIHKKYGPVVRVGRRFLSYTTPDAWNDIYAKVRPELSRDPKSMPPPPSGVYGVGVCPNDADHSRMRRNISHGFTEKALRDQEPILTKYFDALIQKLNENCTKGPVDLSKFFNFVTVDLIGDLTFGQSFDCLETSALHVWMQNIFDFVKGLVVIGVCMSFPPLGTIVLWLGNKLFAEQGEVHRRFVRERLAKRLEMKDPRPDFTTYAQSHLNTPDGMSIEELQETCVSLIVAGSETTASLLSGVVYYILKNPRILERLVKEIRTAFPTEDHINMSGVRDLKYELAVLQEGLRIFPPVANQLQRITGPEGNTIAGRFVPGGTLVTVCQKACNSSAENFRDPYEFVPERWLGDERYKDDRKKALQPFSLGPRNCIGMNLAYMEMRIILARLLWNFDMKLCEESNNWADGVKVFMIYQRQPLLVKLTPVVRG